MTIAEYINSRGLTVRIVAQKLRITKQAISDYDTQKNGPTLKTLTKLANAMTELGAKTEIVDLIRTLESHRNSKKDSQNS